MGTKPQSSTANFKKKKINSSKLQYSMAFHVISFESPMLLFTCLIAVTLNANVLCVQQNRKQYFTLNGGR